MAIPCLMAFISVLVLRRNARRIPPPYSYVETGGIRLHYFEKGDGPPVVLVHGSNGSLQDFKLSVMEGLSQRFRAVAFDRPGHGHSERLAGRQESCASHDDLLIEAWKKIGIERPVLVGHSSAGAVLMDIGVRRPEEVSALVVVSGVVHSWGDEKIPVDFLYRLIRRRYLGALAMWTIVLPLGGLIGRWLLRFSMAPDPVPEAYCRTGLALVLRPGSLRAEAEDLACLQPTLKAIESKYAGISVPLVVVYGEEDRNVPPEGQSLRLHREVRASRLVSLPLTGHIPMLTRPEEVVAAVGQAWEMASH